MTQVTESPYRTEKYLHLHESEDDYIHGEQDLLNNETVFPNELNHTQADNLLHTGRANIPDFPRFFTQPVHSHHHDDDRQFAESGQNLLRRSIDFMKSKMKGWRIPYVRPTLLVHHNGSPKDIIFPHDIPDFEHNRPQKRRLKRTLTDIPSFYSSTHQPILHSPNRFLPQIHAIITTDIQGNILNANDIASLVFCYPRSELCSIKALDLIASSYSEKQIKALTKSENGDENESVLACGKVVPIQKKNNEVSAASLWLKGKKDDCGNSIFIWIFQEIVESTMDVEINQEGIILKASGDLKALYSCPAEELEGTNITTLIPKLETTSVSTYGSSTTILNIEQINKTKFYGSYSALRENFPIIGKIVRKNETANEPGSDSVDVYRFKIVSISPIVGVVTAYSSGIIQACSTDLAKYLFGTSGQALIGKKNIQSLLPQFPGLIEILKSEHDLVEGTVIPESAFRHAAILLKSTYSNHVSSTKISTSPRGPSGITAVHRDGTEFNIDIQMRVIEYANEPLHALWITYDRSLDAGPNENDKARPTIADSKKDDETKAEETMQAEETVDDEQSNSDDEEKFPMSKFLAAGGRPPTQVAEDGMLPDVNPPVIASGEELFDPRLYSAVTRAKTIDDYKILRILGEGAYGVVKLAYNMKDPEKKLVVLKFVFKSKILVDSWIHHEVLGNIPSEIHILHTLRQLSHPNIVQMTDFFEDENHYYIEMNLHGTGMDLFGYIELDASMPETEIKSIFRQVACAVGHLHKNNVVHRDIKDENVILDEDGNIQLIDFGSAAYIQEGKMYNTFRGTLDYAAPEMLTGREYNGPPQDIWALGILLYTLIYRENPFYNINEILSRDLRIPYILSEGSINLIKWMLNRNIDKRPTITEVLNHPWLEE